VVSSWEYQGTSLDSVFDRMLDALGATILLDALAPLVVLNTLAIRRPPPSGVRSVSGRAMTSERHVGAVMPATQLEQG
jgi:hypothetical protein